MLLSIFITLLFPEEFWHRYLCPFGTILSLTGNKAKLAMQVDPAGCNNCGRCRRVCPALAVDKTADHHLIHKKDCLVCFACVDNCPRNVICYHQQINNKQESITS